MTAWVFEPSVKTHTITNLGEARVVRHGDTVRLGAEPHPSLIRAGLRRVGLAPDPEPQPESAATARAERRDSVEPAQAEPETVEPERARIDSLADNEIRDLAARLGWQRAKGRGATDKARAFIAGLSPSAVVDAMRG